MKTGDRYGNPDFAAMNVRQVSGGTIYFGIHQYNGYDGGLVSETKAYTGPFYSTDHYYIFTGDRSSSGYCALGAIMPKPLSATSSTHVTGGWSLDSTY